MDLAIFDLDGTLLDTLLDLANSMNETLAAQNLPTHPVEAYRYFVGEGIEELAARVLPEDRRDKASVALTIENYRAAYARNWQQHTRPYEGIPEMLTKLRSLHLPLAVLSNKPQHFTMLCMQHFFPTESFPVIFGQRDGVPRKPDPAGAREICQLFGVTADRALFIGDTRTDMETGRAAGMVCAGVTWGFRSESELRTSGAHHICHSPDDLLPLFL